MDSMRHLSTSLPGASSRQRTNGHSSDILGDFRAAALSVTNLYKSAAKAQDRARALGYQDALDDLLAFLDKENLGLMDGEGWRVRQWATERLDNEGASPRQPADEEEEQQQANPDRDEARSSSPEVQRRPVQLASSSTELTEDDSASQARRVVSEPPQVSAPQQQAALPTQSDFTFQSLHTYPTNHERENIVGMDLDATATPQHQTSSSTSILPSAHPTTEAVRIISRARGNRHSSHNRRTENRLPTLNFNLGAGAGSKRKIPFQDFFDISGMNSEGDANRKDGGGRGGKRGRHI